MLSRLFIYYAFGVTLFNLMLHILYIRLMYKEFLHRLQRDLAV
jgi:hypothetical protein